MAGDILAKLREEWYSDPDTQPESVEEAIDDELFELQVLFRSRGVTLSGNSSVSISGDEKKQDVEGEELKKNL